MLATLVAASEQGRKEGKPVVIHCEASRLRRSLELKGLQSIIELADSREDAIARLSAGGPEPEPA